MGNKNVNYYLYLFFVFFILLYYRIDFLVFIFLVPLFFHLKDNKKLDIEKIISLLVVSSLINFFFFHPYGFKFLFLVAVAHLLLFIPFILISKYFLNRRYYILSIPLVFYVLFYLFSLTPFNNFWVNFSVFLPYYPILMRYVGSFAMNLFIVLFNVLLFNLLYDYIRDRKINLNIGLFVFILLFLNFFLFNFTIFNDFDSSGLDKLKVVGVQTNLQQSWFEREKNYYDNYESYIALSKDAIKEHSPQILVWPEYAFTHLLELDKNTLDKLSDFSKKNNLTLILGSLMLEDSGISDSKRYNTLYIFDDDGSFRTYNSYEPVMLFDDDVIKEKKDQQILLNGHSLGFAICYEENFPYLFADQVKYDDAQLFFVIGNQYYISNDHGLKLTSMNSNLRAVENNRYIFRLETAGYTTIIDNLGNNIDSLPINREDYIYHEIPLIDDKTFYSIYRQYVEILLFIVSLIGTIAAFFLNRLLLK